MENKRNSGSSVTGFSSMASYGPVGQTGPAHMRAMRSGGVGGRIEGDERASVCVCVFRFGMRELG